MSLKNACVGVGGGGGCSQAGEWEIVNHPGATLERKREGKDMDISSEYIKMCEGINEEHSPEAGDYYFSQGKVIVLPMEEDIGRFCDHECLYLVGSDDYWWLPRQDQLQEMVLKERQDIWMLHCDFNSFVEVVFIRAGETREFKSYEQLWLAFAMREAYGKRWNGEGWRK